MEINFKIKIYRNIIEYVLETTNYTLKDIADLSRSSLRNIRSIYCDAVLPSNFSSEIQLLNLYQMILEINNRKIELKKYLPLPKIFREIMADTVEKQS